MNPNFVAGHLWKRAESGRALEMVYRTYYHATLRERAEVQERLATWEMTEVARHYSSEEERWRERYPFVTPNFFHQIDEYAGTAPNTREDDQDG